MEASQGGPLKFLLDTSVLSQTFKAQPHAGVMGWWSDRAAPELMLSAITIHELRYGFELLPAGKRRQELEAWLDNQVQVDFRGRILAVDAIIADLGGRILAASRMSGHTAEVNDVLIAATARVHGLRVATLNRRHFKRLGVEMVKF